MRILLIDDSKKHREAGVADLSAAGHEVVAVSEYSQIRSLLKDRSFDCALIDLLMPAEEMTLGPEGMNHFGEPFDVGYSLAVYLAIQGIPLVAVATDTGHHDHPASALMDWFHGEAFRVNQSTVCYMHAPMKKVGDAYLKDWVKVALHVLERHT